MRPLNRSRPTQAFRSSNMNDSNKNNKPPIYVEVTSSTSGQSKWIKDIVSHTKEEILAAVAAKKGHLQVTDKYGGVTIIDMEETFVARVQDEDTFLKRSRDANSSR